MSIEQMVSSKDSTHFWFLFFPCKLQHFIWWYSINCHYCIFYFKFTSNFIKFSDTSCMCCRYAYNLEYVRVGRNGDVLCGQLCLEPCEKCRPSDTSARTSRRHTKGQKVTELGARASTPPPRGDQKGLKMDGVLDQANLSAGFSITIWACFFSWFYRSMRPLPHSKLISAKTKHIQVVKTLSMPLMVSS